MSFPDASHHYQLARMMVTGHPLSSSNRQTGCHYLHCWGVSLLPSSFLVVGMHGDCFIFLSCLPFMLPVPRKVVPGARDPCPGHLYYGQMTLVLSAWFRINLQPLLDMLKGEHVTVPGVDSLLVGHRVVIVHPSLLIPISCKLCQTGIVVLV
jgi:hypothetical protein